jgi:hypothetical protein
MPSIPSKAYPLHLRLSCVQLILSEIFYLGWNLCVLLVGHVHVVKGEAVAQLVAKRSLRKKKNLSNLVLWTCTKNPIYVFPKKELRGLSPHSYIYVSVSYLHIPRIGPHICCSKIDRPILEIYKSLTDI